MWKPFWPRKKRQKEVNHPVHQLRSFSSRDGAYVYSVFELSQNHEGDPTYKKINRLDTNKSLRGFKWAFFVVTSHTLLLTLTTFGVMLFWFISQCCQWQHNAVCCKTGCGGVDSFDGVSYSEFRSRTADRSWTPRPALCRYVCGWDWNMMRPECENGENLFSLQSSLKIFNELWPRDTQQLYNKDHEKHP